MIERCRAQRKLKPDQKCPGERKCVTVGIISQKAGATIENFCKPDRCELFHTKPGSVPAEFAAEVEGAFDLFRKAEAHFVLHLGDYPSWQVDAYLLYLDVRAELDAEDPDDKPKGGVTGEVKPPKGDSGAFDFKMPEAAAPEDEEER